MVRENGMTPSTFVERGEHLCGDLGLSSLSPFSPKIDSSGENSSRRDINARI